MLNGTGSKETLFINNIGQFLTQRLEEAEMYTKKRGEKQKVEKY